MENSAQNHVISNTNPGSYVNTEKVLEPGEIRPELANDNQSISSNIETVDPDGNTYPDGGFQAWSNVFGSLCAFFSSLAIINSLGAYQAWLSANELSNSTPNDIGWIFGVHSFVSFFAGLQWGPLFDAFGPRYLTVAGSVLLMATYLTLGACRQYWHFFLVFGIIGGLSTSLLFTAAMGTIQHWFYDRRGLATGIALAGGSLGGIVFPLILGASLEKVGFAWSTRLIAFILVPFSLAAILLMRGRFFSRQGAGWRRSIPDLTPLKVPRFALLTVGIFLMEWGLFIPVAYLTSYALHYGMPSTISYQILTFLNVGSLIGRWVAGSLGDRFGRLNTQIMAISLCVVAILGMWLPAGGNVGVVVAFAIIFGLASGSNISLTPVIISQLCKTEEYGRSLSAAYTVSSFAALTGIPIAGQILLVTGEYWGLVAFAGLSYTVALLCFVVVRIMSAGWNPQTKV